MMMLLAAVLASTLSAASASVPTAAFAEDGTLWVTWVDGAHVYAAASQDVGKTFAAAVPINPEPESIDANGEARPKIAVGRNQEVYVSYTRKGERPFTGDVRFSRRLPDGRFSAPVTVNDDGLATGHRFDTLTVGPSGDVHLFWIDKRDLERAAQEHETYEGAAVYEAVSTDGGQTFAPNRRIKEHVCECCHLAVAWDGATPLLFWRDLVPGGIRDHALARVEARGPLVATRATDDDWEIQGCPHHGPALAVDAKSTIHLAWFTGAGKRGKGAFYRRSTDGGRTFSEPMPLGVSATRPQLLAVGKGLWVAWKEVASDGATVVRVLFSPDRGQTWRDRQDVARTRGESDHALLVARGGRAFLSWFTKDEGYRVVPIERR